MDYGPVFNFLSLELKHLIHVFRSRNKMGRLGEVAFVFSGFTIFKLMCPIRKPTLHHPLACTCRWSSGVIMYTLLAGSPPFWHRKQMLMLRMILSGSYDFSSPEWEDRSDTVKDLVSHEVFFSAALH